MNTLGGDASPIGLGQALSAMRGLAWALVVIFLTTALGGFIGAALGAVAASFILR